MNRDILEKKVLPILGYVGVIGAALMSCGYIIVVFVMINGFQYTQTKNALVFAIVNAIVGFIIMQFLKVQGIAFAENDPENIAVTKEYFGTKTKDKKPHSLVYFWVTGVIKDVLTKGVSVVITTFGMIYIVVEGSHDYNLLLLAFVNLVLFICFGLLALNNAYKYYYNSYIPYLREQISLSKELKDDQNCGQNIQQP